MIDNLRTVLYIEDNCANALLLQRVLSYRPSIRLLAAQNGREGLSLAQEHAPDLILLDLHLPDMHGDQVLSCLHHHPRTAQSPVVMISVGAIGGEIDRLMELGACAYITKPFDVAHLLYVVDHALSVSALNAVGNSNHLL
jgi:CheY-like chemotaxis protein